jgi:hypothetical protein
MPRSGCLLGDRVQRALGGPVHRAVQHERPRPFTRTSRGAHSRAKSSLCAASSATRSSALEQLEDNLGALDVEFTDDQLAALDRASAVELGFPHEWPAR